MSLAELLVSVLILGLSSQVALQGWVRVLDLQRDARTTEQTLQSSDQLLLAARRLLSSTTSSSSTDWSAEASCRLALPEAPELAAARPTAAGVDQLSSVEVLASWQQEPTLDGLWLQLSVRPSSGGDPSWQRRVLFTAAGLGRCSEALG